MVPKSESVVKMFQQVLNRVNRSFCSKPSGNEFESTYLFTVHCQEKGLKCQTFKLG